MATLEQHLHHPGDAAPERALGAPAQLVDVAGRGRANEILVAGQELVAQAELARLGAVPVLARADAFQIERRAVAGDEVLEQRVRRFDLLADLSPTSCELLEPMSCRCIPEACREAASPHKHSRHACAGADHRSPDGAPARTFRAMRVRREPT